MELYLQFGYGMMEHCRHLISEWGGGPVVLSTRDMSGKQLLSLASEITALSGGRVIVDPQFYLPHADHQRLCSHQYWPWTSTLAHFFQGAALRELLEKIFALNDDAGSSSIILPVFWPQVSTMSG